MITISYKESLMALIDLYEKKKSMIRGGEIAKILGKSPGTIRNQMQTLRALGYVEGIPGPKGGYKPNLKAYEAVDMEKKNEAVIEVPVYQNEKKIEGIQVKKISFTDIGNPQKCSVRISVLGDTKKIRDNTQIKIGPTPVNKMIVQGKVIGRDDTNKELLLETNSIISIPKITAGSFISHELITVPSEMSIGACESLLLKNNIESAPVMDSSTKTILGIVSLRDIAVAFVNGKNNATVGEIIDKNQFYTVNKKTQISDCMAMMRKYKTKRLVIVDSSNKPLGIITRTDIVNMMADWI